MFGTLSKARLVNTDSTQVDNTFTVMFNPESLSIQRSISWTEHTIPGLDVPAREFSSGGSRTLSFDLHFDTSTTGLDVVSTYLDDLEELTLIDKARHRPPLVRFEWGSISLRGVITRFDVDYLRFTAAGVPVRVKVAVTLEETSAAVTTEKESPDHTKLHTVKLGETLDQIAMAEYDDPAHWKTIAQANDLTHPARLVPGQRLVLPRLF